MDPMDEDTPSSQEHSIPSGPSTVAAGKQPATGRSSAPSSSAPTPSTSSAAAQQLNKRRRGPGVVTPNACTECRKKRAKARAPGPVLRYTFHRTLLTSGLVVRRRETMRSV